MDDMDDFEIERRNVGDGWQDIVVQLHWDLFALDPNYQVTQIKEKFGGLRYYIEISEGIEPETQRRMHELTYRAEEQSLKTCQVCGAPGKLDGSRWWLRTLCKAHTGTAPFTK